MSRIASGKLNQLESMLSQLYQPKFDLRSAFDAALAPAGMPDGDGTEDEELDDDAGAGDGSGDAGGDAGGSGDGNDSGVKDPDKKKLSDEAAANRVKAKQEKDRADKAEAELRKIQDKDKSELEKAQRDLNEYKDKYEKASALVVEKAYDVEFALKHAAKFNDPELALLALRKDTSIKVDEDG
jgi:hypothetical protein